MSLLRGVQRLARVALGGAAAAVMGRLPLLPRSCLAALRSRLRISSAYPTTAAPSRRSRFALYSSAGWVKCGGIHDEPGREMDPEAIELARFAVAEHNSKTNGALEFVRLVKVRGQLVAGTMYYFTIEVREVDGANKLYEAKVWLRPWEDFKGLDKFEPVANAGQGEGKTKV